MCVLCVLASLVCVKSCPSIIAVLSFFFLAWLKICEDLIIADSHDQFGYLYTRAELQVVLFPLR